MLMLGIKVVLLQISKVKSPTEVAELFTLVTPRGISSHQSKSFASRCRPRLAVSLNGSTSLRLFDSHASQAVGLLLGPPAK